MRSTRSMGMLSTKQQRLAAGDIPLPAPPVRRRGVDKSQPGDAPLQPVPEEPPLSLQATQEIDLLDDEPVDEDEATFYSSEEDSENEREFDAECEELFNAKLDAWFAEYAPKLFELNQTKWNNKQAKKEKKPESSKSVPRTAPPTKKRKIS